MHGGIPTKRQSAVRIRMAVSIQTNDALMLETGQFRFYVCQGDNSVKISPVTGDFSPVAGALDRCAPK
jgi:hypothetical protein